MVGRTIGTRRENENTNFPVMESAVTKKNGNVISGMEEWYQLQTPPAVVRALSELGFRTPTEIQRRAIPPAIEEQCNVIGAAETVSWLILLQFLAGNGAICRQPWNGLHPCVHLSYATFCTL